MTTINGYNDKNSSDVVISGFSGRFPESNNVEEFKLQLFDGIDLITDDERRWPSGIHGLPTRTGKLLDIEHFDATFFRIHSKLANKMDPQLRLLLESTYESIIDAGVNPQDIRGSRTGVFVGACANEANEYWDQDPENIDGYGMLGCTRAMIANRISFAFDFKGPSYAVDTLCASSLFAFQQAVSAIRTDQCDAAIVGGVNLLLKPAHSLDLHRLTVLSPQGKCKTFDETADGYVRSEAVVAIYLQRASQAKRIYATVVNAKTNNDGAKEQGIFFPAGTMLKQLIEEAHTEVGINPADVAYIEPHGTGTQLGDTREMNTLADVFAKGRKSPLLVGSVKSNMGHSEAASGLCSIVKILVAMETGIIPANLHFNKPNSNIPGLLDGRLQVVNKAWPWNGGLAAVNSFGAGGTNAHIILRSNPKNKSVPVQNKIPCIVCVSGRTKEAVDYKLTKIEETPRDENFIRLIHEIYSKSIHNHNYRGYTVLEAPILTKEVKPFNNKKRPIWYVFSGFGSQWAGMCNTLMQLDVFRNSICKCANALQPEGMDLISILNSESEETFENIVNSSVAITATQIALVDVLTAVGISPDGIIGHSAGEICCAYVDGAFTAEQAILVAFWKGRSILEPNLPPGKMAAIGLSWEETKARAPADIDAACHNSDANVSIAGPPNSVANFVESLTLEGIFAREIKSSGVAFHSRYTAEAAPIMRKHLEKVIPSPTARTPRWISTSIPESAWDTPLAQQSSAAYHVNNLLSPVLFHEAISHIPKDAVVIEIAPHSLLQSLLKRSLGPDSINVGLLRKGTTSNISVLLSSLGKLFNAGINLSLANLYPPVEFPVPRGTPMLQSLIKWDHSSKWAVPSFSHQVAIQRGPSSRIGCENVSTNGVFHPECILSFLHAMNNFLHQPHSQLHPYPVMASSATAIIKEQKTSGNKHVSLIETVGKILGIEDTESIDLNSSLADLGMDSLMGPEIKETLRSAYNVQLSFKEISRFTFRKLLELETSTLGDVPS